MIAVPTVCARSLVSRNLVRVASAKSPRVKTAPRLQECTWQYPHVVSEPDPRGLVPRLTHTYLVPSLVPRPSPAPVFDACSMQKLSQSQLQPYNARSYGGIIGSGLYIHYRMRPGPSACILAVQWVTHLEDCCFNLLQFIECSWKIGITRRYRTNDHESLIANLKINSCTVQITVHDQ